MFLEFSMKFYENDVKENVLSTVSLCFNTILSVFFKDMVWKLTEGSIFKVSVFNFFNISEVFLVENFYFVQTSGLIKRDAFSVTLVSFYKVDVINFFKVLLSEGLKNNITCFL